MWFNVLQFPFSISELRLICQIHHYRLGFRESLESVDATLSADATLLGTTERYRKEVEADTVNAHHAGLQIGGNPESSVDVLSKDARHEPKSRVIRQCNDLLFGLEAADDRNRTKYFFSVNLRLDIHVGKDGRFDEKALRGC
jgi:hypothetical protein